MTYAGQPAATTAGSEKEVCAASPTGQTTATAQTLILPGGYGLLEFYPNFFPKGAADHYLKELLALHMEPEFWNGRQSKREVIHFAEVYKFNSSPPRRLWNGRR